MKLIVITSPDTFEGETQELCRMLEAGIDRLHIRKPDMSRDQLRQYILSIPSDMRCYLSLHDHYELAEETGIGGVHLNKRNHGASAPQGVLKSRSLHSLAEVAEDKESDYVFLSPVFDSISKTGYRSAYGDTELREASMAGIIGPRTFALGGVSLANLDKVQKLGFGGAALLGCIWGADSPSLRLDAVNKIIRWRDYNS